MPSFFCQMMILSPFFRTVLGYFHLPTISDVKIWYDVREDNRYVFM
jgi:hypothetical protein